MKLLYGLIICVALAMISSSCDIFLSLSSGIVSTLYAISGIMFSIGMSLIITSNTAEVKNLRAKKIIRKEMRIVRNHYLSCFALVSVMYIALFSKIEDPKTTEFIPIYKNLVLNYSDLMVIVMAYSIFYFTVNFLTLQRLNTQIEDAD